LKVRHLTLFGFDWPGATKEDEHVTGTITIPEVAHDTEEDEYVVFPLPASMLNFSLTSIFSRKPPRNRRSVLSSVTNLSHNSVKLFPNSQES
jgi:hypothetical protein